MFRTADQKIEHADCPLARAAHIVGDSWVLLIVRDLLESSRRFGELEKNLTGISTRTLTKKLCELESNGLIIRTDSKTKPPCVTYSLTKQGQGLREVTDTLRAFGKKYLK